MKTNFLWVKAIVVVAIFCITGCKKDNDQLPNSDSNQQKIYYPVKITGSDVSRIYTYSANPGILKSIKTVNSGRDTTYSISYNTFIQPSYLDIIVNGSPVSQTHYTLNDRGEVIRGEVFNVETDGWDWMVTTLKSSYNLSYNTSGQLTRVDYFKLDGTKESEAVFDYNNEGNISGLKSSGIINLEYDKFNGIAKSLKYLHLFFVEGGDHLLFYNKNNPVRLNETSRTYIYNQDKYPVEMSIASPNGTSVYSIEYALK